ncbi:hypothetical protein FZEAL_8238 [Fusarium zealandicum]|uniref:Uncharacterized protein n=1 Tax=Fusarium zealandicum TaxID=1053134 RepID=A0A8H4UE68_9HYPO|nr:hypothetical protein FZEAL_8238 [Fusarium zealandicum]
MAPHRLEQNAGRVQALKMRCDNHIVCKSRPTAMYIGVQHLAEVASLVDEWTRESVSACISSICSMHLPLHAPLAGHGSDERNQSTARENHASALACGIRTRDRGSGGRLREGEAMRDETGGEERVTCHQASKDKDGGGNKRLDGAEEEEAWTTGQDLGAVEDD